MNQDEGHDALQSLYSKYAQVLQVDDEHSWRENIEGIFIALVIALAIKAYFFQPFRIPTHSMNPSLLGILSESHEGSKPNPIAQTFDFVLKGKSYHRIIPDQDGKILSVSERKSFAFLTFTNINISGKEYSVWATLSEIHDAGYSLSPDRPGIPLYPGTEVKAGKDLVNFSVEMGDYVFVNKMTYHFRLPKRGEVFVFTTRGIMGIPQNGITSDGSQFYIKRCVGIPGDVLSINPPHLISNGEILKPTPVFEKIYSMKNGYHGYVHAVGSPSATLKDSDETITIPQESYWAMGDNSRSSFDSRYWGAVARENLVGTGAMVAWPFTSRWGFIR